MTLDTSIGGARDFPSTQWSQLAAARGETKRAALARLAEAYWKPVYVYVRAKWSRSNEDAKDLTQEFFVWMLETDFVNRADPSRGRFRAFLKVSLEHFLRQDARDRARLKRGGGREVLALERMSGAPMDPAAAPPEQSLDDAWRAEILERATHLLRESYESEGKTAYFRVFEDYFLSEAEDVDYKTVASRHGLTPTDVSNYLMNAKRRYRQLIADVVSQTVASADELRREMAELFGEESP